MTPIAAGASEPKVWTIPAGVPFVDALCRGLLAESQGDPMALAGMIVLLPTRRAVTALRDAFLRAGDGAPMLLPRLLALGDLDADELDLLSDDAEGEPFPPALPKLRRQCLLARLILGRAGFTPAAAFALAGDLAALFDELAGHGRSPRDLVGLVPEDHARHWQITLDFLNIVLDHWPAIVAEAGAMEPAQRRDAILAAQARLWRETPPTRRVIVAGSTGSIAATAELIVTVAGLPRGAVILPGLDKNLDPALWEALEPTHPQYLLGQLTEKLGVERDRVPEWPTARLSAVGRERAALINAALTPPLGLENRTGAGAVKVAAALTGLTRLDCLNPQQEAGVIALLLRETLERPGATAALVTPDRDLARRVVAELGRWGIAIDDSAGVPLSRSAPAVFLRLVEEVVASDFAPVPLLALMKHPLTATGLEPVEARRRARSLERLALRGPRPAPGIAGLNAALAVGDSSTARDRAGLALWLKAIERALAPLIEAGAGGPLPLENLVRRHIAAAEALAATDRESGAERLWRRAAGEAAANLIADLLDAADALPPMAPSDYGAFFATLLAGGTVRPREARHPRLAIWGLLEARLQQVDRMILAGLNEGTWPADPPADPWLSRPMRAKLGLPAPERRIGQTAHDFVQAFGAPEVFITRAQRVGGAPTVPSRWLQRLDAHLKSLGVEASPADSGAWLGWQGALDRPTNPEPATVAPAPRPPVAARPRRLSITEIEAWMRDPYAIYAKHVLGLRALDPLDADAGAAEKGSIIHAALEGFTTEFPTVLPPDALARLIEHGRIAFDPWFARPAVAAFWWPRFEAVARWFIATESERRRDCLEIISERKGSFIIEGPGGPFTLNARADRIERRRDGTLAIVDYKTGQPPAPKDIEAGVSPQLPLEAAMAAAGGFRDLAGAPISDLEFWRLSGGNPPGERKQVGGDPAKVLALAEAALEGLTRLVAVFDDPTTPYAAVPRPQFAPRFNDYAHLARMVEWGGEGET